MISWSRNKTISLFSLFVSFKISSYVNFIDFENIMFLSFFSIKKSNNVQNIIVFYRFSAFAVSTKYMDCIYCWFNLWEKNSFIQLCVFFACRILNDWPRKTLILQTTICRQRRRHSIFHIFVVFVVILFLFFT